MTTIDDAVDGLSAREAERLMARLEKRLQACAIDGRDGAIPVRGAAKLKGNETRFSLMLCPACIERHRLPELRAEASGG